MFTIKICGIRSVADAQAVVASGADAIGLNFYPKSKRFVEISRASEICQAVSTEVLRVGVFVNETADRIREIVDATGVDAVQLHGDEPVSILSDLNTVPVIRAFRCRNGDLLAVKRFLDAANDQMTPPAAVLLDAFDPNEYGGTGRSIDPQLLASRPDVLRDIHWVLAGGLTAANVAEAIRIARPCGVDTASGVERAPGVKDRAKLNDFSRNAGQALQSIAK